MQISCSFLPNTHTHTITGKNILMVNRRWGSFTAFCTKGRCVLGEADAWLRLKWGWSPLRLAKIVFENNIYVIIVAHYWNAEKHLAYRRALILIDFREDGLNFLGRGCLGQEQCGHVFGMMISNTQISNKISIINCKKKLCLIIYLSLKRFQ